MGQWYSQLCSPPRPVWTEDKIPDLHGKVMIVTGGNSGIGKRTCEVLYQKGAKVYLACRDPKKATEAINDIVSSSSATGSGSYLNTKSSKSSKRSVPSSSSSSHSLGSLHFLQLDLSSLSSIHNFATEFQSLEPRLDVLFNSAGVMWTPEGSMTRDGYELQFGTNCLGHFALIRYLLPLLEETSKRDGVGRGQVRIINTSSLGHALAPKNGIDFNHHERYFFDSTKQLSSSSSKNKTKKVTSSALYHESKLGLVLLTKHLTRLYPPTTTPSPILSFSLNPGAISTSIARHTCSAFRSLMTPLAHSPRLGALTQLWLGLAGEGDGVGCDRAGGYGIPWARWGKEGHALAEDRDLEERLWEWCTVQVERHEKEVELALDSKTETGSGRGSVGGKV